MHYHASISHRPDPTHVVKYAYVRDFPGIENLPNILLNAHPSQRHPEDGRLISSVPKHASPLGEVDHSLSSTFALLPSKRFATGRAGLMKRSPLPMHTASQGFQKDFEKYGANNAQIVGVSVDSIEKVQNINDSMVFMKI